MSSNSSVIKRKIKNSKRITTPSILPHEYLIKNLYHHQQQIKYRHSKRQHKNHDSSQ